MSSLRLSPFNFVSNVDNDTEFVAIGQANLRPYNSIFQRLQDYSYQWLPYKPLVLPARNPIGRAAPEIRQVSGFQGHWHGHGGCSRRSCRRLRLDVRFCVESSRRVRTPSMFLTCSLTVRALSDKGSRCIGLGPSVTSLATLCLAAFAKGRRHCVKRHSL